MRAVYDNFAAYYDRAFAPFERRFLGAWRREAISMLPLNASLLELGAGTGANFEFYPPSRIAVSTELSCEMMAVAVRKRGSNLLVRADAQALPFSGSSFDAAFATLVFCSIPDPNLAFAELRRVVRPGGRVVLLEHVRPPGLRGRLFDIVNIATTALIDDHFNRRTADTAVSNGFKLIEVRRKALGAVNLIICENPGSGAAVESSSV